MWLSDKTVVNRRNIPVEAMFDAKLIQFPPLGKVQLPSAVAFSIVKDSMLNLNVETGQVTIYALGIEGEKGYPTAPLEGELATENKVELIDRTDQAQMEQTEPVILKKTKAGLATKKVGKGKKAIKPKTAHGLEAPEKLSPKVLSTGVVQPVGPMRTEDVGDHVLHKKG